MLGWGVTLVQNEISQQLLHGLQWHVVQTFTVLGRLIIMALVSYGACWTKDTGVNLRAKIIAPLMLKIRPGTPSRFYFIYTYFFLPRKAEVKRFMKCLLRQIYFWLISSSSVKKKKNPYLPKWSDCRLKLILFLSTETSFFLWYSDLIKRRKPKKLHMYWRLLLNLMCCLQILHSDICASSIFSLILMSEFSSDSLKIWLLFHSRYVSSCIFFYLWIIDLVFFRDTICYICILCLGLVKPPHS